MEELSYLTAVGIDKGEKERLAVSFVIAKPKGGGDGDGDKKEGGGGGSGGEDKSKDSIITIEAPTLSAAVAYLNTISLRPTSLAQTKLFLISEQYARKEGLNVLDEAARERDIRRASLIVITKQSVRSTLSAFKADVTKLNQFASIQASKESKRSGFLPVHASLNDHLIRASTDYEESVAFYAAVLPKGKDGGDQQSDHGGGDQQSSGGDGQGQQPGKEHRLVPGASKRKGGPAVDLFGAAAFHQTKMVGVLDAEDTRILLILENTFRYSQMQVRDPEDPKRELGIRLERGRPTKVVAAIGADGRPRFTVQMNLEGELAASPEQESYGGPEQRADLDAAIAAQIKRQAETFFKKTQGWNADVGGLGRALVRKFPTVAAWDRYDWPKRYKDAAITVNVRVKLRRYGVEVTPNALGGRGKIG